ncbi:unnamed protein product, partial [Durusdinium trenchii]
ASPGKLHALPHLGRAFTDVQEAKQVAAGVSFVQKSLESFNVRSVKTTLLVDMFGYDAFPALASLQETQEGRDCLCATLCFENSGQDLINRIANEVYEQARSGQLQLSSFPSFEPLVNALKQGNATQESKHYRVSVQRHDQLLVLDTYARKWLDDSNFADQANEVIKNHNAEYNASGDFLMTSEEAGDDAAESVERPTKRIKLESCKTEDVMKLPQSKVLQINNTCDLVAGGDKIYMSSRNRNQFFQLREMFSFGSGEWRSGKEASETTEDPDGRWFSFDISGSDYIILEKKSLPTHLQAFENADTAVTLQSIISDLQDLGEVKMELSHHEQDSDGNFKSAKPLVFVLDEPPEDGVKKENKKPKKTAPITAKTFGAYVSIPGVKDADNLCLAWRC